MRRSRRESVFEGTNVRKLQSAREGLFQFEILVAGVESLGFRENEKEIRLGFRLRYMMHASYLAMRIKKERKKERKKDAFFVENVEKKF